MNKKGTTILYLLLVKALYGIMQAAVLFYKKLSGDLISKGFLINPSDKCVANKIINGNQMTIVWHVDDMKISHKDPVVVTRVIRWLKSIYDTLQETKMMPWRIITCLSYNLVDFFFQSNDSFQVMFRIFYNLNKQDFAM